MPRTPRLGIRYPELGSQNLGTDIQNMMTDIDVAMGLVNTDATVADNPDSLWVYGGNYAAGGGGWGAMSFTGELYDTAGVWVIGTPTQFNFPAGWWLLNCTVSMSLAAGNITFAALWLQWNDGATTWSLGHSQISNINNGSADLTVTTLVRIFPGGGPVYAYVTAAGGAFTFSDGVMSAIRIRRTV